MPKETRPSTCTTRRSIIPSLQLRTRDFAPPAEDSVLPRNYTPGARTGTRLWDWEMGTIEFIPSMFNCTPRSRPNPPSNYLLASPMSGCQNYTQLSSPMTPRTTFGSAGLGLVVDWGKRSTRSMSSSQCRFLKELSRWLWVRITPWHLRNWGR